MTTGRTYVALLGLLLVLSPASGFCSSIVGIVNDSQGNPVNGCIIDVTDSTGKVVADGRTDLYGRYCIAGVEPGAYTLVLDPGKTGMQGGSDGVTVQPEGLTADWAAAKDHPAHTKTTAGIASGADATCAGAPLVGALTTTELLVGAGVVAIGTGIGLGVGLGTGGGGGGGPTPKTKHK